MIAKECENDELRYVGGKEENEPIEVIFYEAEPEFYQSVFIHPYEGKVLLVKNHYSGFFDFVLKGHIRLWLPKIIGEYVVSFSVLFYFIMVISGIILWWPKRKSQRKHKFKFNWKSSTRWKRKNYDLHSIIGFYSSALISTLIFTGCVMAFGVFYFLTYKAFGGDKNFRFEPPIGQQVENNSLATQNLDRLVYSLLDNTPEASSLEVHVPESDTATILVEVFKDEAIHYNIDYRFFDQTNLKEMPNHSIYGKYEHTDVADKVIRMNYDIHIGSIGGIWGKILAFICSLISASLPVTGFTIWLGRKKKNRLA